MTRNITINQFVGQKIRLHREKLGLSQEEFAERCGLHRTYVGSVERGERNITLNTLAKLSDALNIPLAKLVSE